MNSKDRKLLALYKTFEGAPDERLNALRALAVIDGNGALTFSDHDELERLAPKLAAGLQSMRGSSDRAKVLRARLAETEISLGKETAAPTPSAAEAPDREGYLTAMGQLPKSMSKEERALHQESYLRQFGFVK